MKSPKICVVGSSNYDLIAYADKLPKKGETILGSSFRMGFGGKGANQAVASAKIGAQVTMVTKLGNDIFGKQTLENYKNLNMNTDYIYFTDEVASGVATIWVDKDGNNSIIVSSGANDYLTAIEIEAARNEIAGAHMLICQNEISFSVTKKALQIAREEKVTTFFNPAPAYGLELSKDFFELIDILCLNESEAEFLSKRTVKNVDDALYAGKVLLDKGVPKILLTLGENGCVLVTKELSCHVPAYKVKACDTTGAGDCFIGSYAYFLACGLSDLEAIKRANFIASLSVQKLGTQSSFPEAKDLPAELFGVEGSMP